MERVIGSAEGSETAGRSCPGDRFFSDTKLLATGGGSTFPRRRAEALNVSDGKLTRQIANPMPTVSMRWHSHRTAT
jgi:hypothetical protein